MAILPAVNMAM